MLKYKILYLGIDCFMFTCGVRKQSDESKNRHTYSSSSGIVIDTLLD